jgi:rare lipoprotein A (peptidoglycan hydrolase)
MPTAFVKRVMRADSRSIALWALLMALGATVTLPATRALANTTGGAEASGTAAGSVSTQPSAGGGSTPTGQTGKLSLATWFGPGFYGSTTACGQRMSPKLVGVASRTLACGTLVQISYRGRQLTVPVVDRGPYGHIGATWDLTAGTARALKITETVRIATEIVGSLPNTPILGQPTETEASQAPLPAASAPSATAASTGGGAAH